MCFKRLAVALISNVPNSQRLIVGDADDVFTAGVKQQTPHPVVMSNLHNRQQVGGV